MKTHLLGRGRADPARGSLPPRPGFDHGFVGAALSANIIHWFKKDGEWIWKKIIDVENERHPEWPIPVPGLISVILISMDDRFLYFCNWLHGDIRQYDISDPSQPEADRPGLDRRFARQGPGGQRPARSPAARR